MWELQRGQTRIRKKITKTTLEKCRNYLIQNGEHSLTQSKIAKPLRRPFESQELPANTSFTASRRAYMPFTCFLSIIKDHLQQLLTLKISPACS
jgi:hypothetical protein